MFVNLIVRKNGRIITMHKVQFSCLEFFLKGVFETYGDEISIELSKQVDKSL